jgi:hypothetical protein
MGGVELIDKVGGTMTHKWGLRSTLPWPKERSHETPVYACENVANIISAEI